MALSLKHPAVQDLPHKLPREFAGQWQHTVETPEFRFVKEIEIRDAGQAHTISGMAELKHARSGLVLNYYPTFTLRDDRPRRLKAWFEILTAIECKAGGGPAFRLPTMARTILRLKVDGTRLKLGTVEGEFTSEGLHFHVAQTHDLVGGYKRVG
jgi:hypothetical protein